MEKIKSLADLKRIKENVQTKIDLREKSEQVESLIQIKVAMATCGIAAGSKDTMNYFIENLEKNGKPGKDPIVFGHVTTERAEEIIQKYLKNDELVADIIPVNFETI